MKVIVAVKNNKSYYGSAEKIAGLVGVTGEAIRRQIREGKIEVTVKNGYIIYLNAERVK